MIYFALPQAQEDAAAETSKVTIPDARAGKDAIVDAAKRNVFAQMDTDRKTTALKSLQVCFKMNLESLPVGNAAARVMRCAVVHIYLL